MAIKLSFPHQGAAPVRGGKPHKQKRLAAYRVALWGRRRPPTKKPRQGLGATAGAAAMMRSTAWAMRRVTSARA